MVSGSSKAVLVVGILVGALLLGGLIGAAIDFASGTQGWWGVGALLGLMAASIWDTVLLAKPGRLAR